MTRLTALLQTVRGDFPGILLCAVIALAASFVSDHYGGPLLLFALLIGIAFNFLHTHPRTQAGIERCSQTVLRWAVALLGARITAEQVAGLGWQTVELVIGAVLSTLLLGIFLARRFGLERWQGAVSGGSVAICGASAALAIASVLPASARRDSYTIVVVVSVTALSTVSMVLYPILTGWLDLSHDAQGLFLGATIHDVAQVIGAGYGVGHDTGDVATLVKLFRVALLALVVIGVGLAFRARAEDIKAQQGRAPLIPWFLAIFIALVALNSTGALNLEQQGLLTQLSKACLVIAIAALGVKTSFAEVAKAGWQSFALICIETVWIALFVLAAIFLVIR
ncbi:MAG: putative sulfate exporter family transporter [Pseudomonadota bacterium]